MRGRGGPYRAARPEPEVLRSVCHSPVRKAPPDRGRSCISSNLGVEYRRSLERNTEDSRGFGYVRGPVRRSGV